MVVTMDNCILAPFSTQLESLSLSLGFTKTLFLEKDFTFLEKATKKQLLALGKKPKTFVIYRPENEELLRFALERTGVQMVIDVEHIHPKNHTHYVRGGIDQVLAKIATKQGKTLGISFSSLLSAKYRPQQWARSALNIKVCHKYQTPLFFGSFASSETDFRSAEDLFAIWQLLGGRTKEELTIRR